MKPFRLWLAEKILPGVKRETVRWEDEYIQRLKEKSTRRLDKEFFLLISGVLVKVKLSGSRLDILDCYVRCEYRVMEIDGIAVSVKEQEEKMEYFESRDLIPTVEDQYETVLKTLKSFGLYGRPMQVTSEYALGHLRAVNLQRRLGERR